MSSIGREKLEKGGLILLVAGLTVGLVWIVSSFIGALLWAALAALLFQPLFQYLLRRWPDRRNAVAGLTLLIITVAVVIPAMVIGTLVVQQATGVYTQIRSGQINVAAYFQSVHDALPLRLQGMLEKWGLGSFELIQARLTQALSDSASLLTRRALTIGANAAGFVLAFGVGLYVTFFLLRDGEHLAPKVVRALPLEPAIARQLADRFALVVRATIKGSGVVALVQGALGAITFWIVGLPAALLWGLLMTIAALLPAVGPAIIWAPVAVYLFAIDAFWQAIVVILSGVLVIGLADNVLRPMLVGRDTGIPDWLVLVTTLGGIDLLGLSGIVIGPLCAALFIACWHILTVERQEEAPARTPARRTRARKAAGAEPKSG